MSNRENHLRALMRTARDLPPDPSRIVLVVIADPEGLSVASYPLTDEPDRMLVHLGTMVQGMIERHGPRDVVVYDGDRRSVTRSRSGDA